MPCRVLLRDCGRGGFVPARDVLAQDWADPEEPVSSLPQKLFLQESVADRGLPRQHLVAPGVHHQTLLRVQQRVQVHVLRDENGEFRRDTHARGWNRDPASHWSGDGS